MSCSREGMGSFIQYITEKGCQRITRLHRIESKDLRVSENFIVPVVQQTDINGSMVSSLNQQYGVKNKLTFI